MTATSAVGPHWQVAVGCQPEKRKVGGSTPPLTTRFACASGALGCENLGSCFLKRMGWLGLQRLLAPAARSLVSHADHSLGLWGMRLGTFCASITSSMLLMTVSAQLATPWPWANTRNDGKQPLLSTRKGHWKCRSSGGAYA